MVTSFEFRLHPVDVVLGGLVMYPRDQAAEVLRFFREFTRTAPDELTLYAAMLHMVDAFQPMPFPAMQTLLDPVPPDGNQNYWKSSCLGELGDEAIRVLVEPADEAGSPHSAVIVEFHGGVAGRVGATETAYAQRKAELAVGPP